jgi:hypothetical protein
MSSHLDPARFARAIVLESSDIPAHMTIAQWRRHKQAVLRDQRAQALAGRRWRRWSLRAVS